MANIAYRRKRKNNTGSYDTVYYETDSRIVMRPNGESVEDSLKKNVYVRPNLLDNWYFVGGGTDGKFPINQKGKTEYVSSNIFDRWMIVSAQGMIELTDSGCTIQCLSEETNQIILNQNLSLPNIDEEATITVSIIVDDNIFNDWYISGSIGIGNMQLIGNGLHNFIFKYKKTLNPTLYLFRNGFNNESSIKLIAAKLEIGDTQTLAYQDNNGKWQLYETPDYASELLKCQRYLLPVAYGSELRVSPNYINQNGIFYNIPIPNPMRDGNPTIICDKIRVYSNGDQTGFTFFTQNMGNCIVICAAKDNHGLTINNHPLLTISDLLFSLEI